MDPVTWQRARELFEQALELDAEERPDFIERGCGTDSALRHQVDLLLQAHRESNDTFLDPPDEFGAGPLLARQDESADRPEQIGAYRILSPIASGGMGTVYRAEQDHPRRDVALKIMQTGLADAEARHRFHVEAEILGRLRHPAIAQVFEAGTWRPEHATGGDELPYFAMEYVEEARTILQFAEERGLDLRQRIELFRTACAGVDHGHQKGVIHRDLKPANILVDGQGHPKIIDFGVARATRSDVAETFRTLPGTVVGTLQYMSPEQVSGSGEVDTRSDVYSLGVVLYRLLCGSYPYSLEGATLTEVARRIHTIEPISPRSIRSDLPIELEWIVLRALEKDWARRYASVTELADDLGRFLQHEPVRAGPPSAAYRMRKFVRRHPAKTGILAALVVGLIGTSIGFVRADRKSREAQAAQAVAEAEARRAVSIADFCNHLFLSVGTRQLGRDGRISDLLLDASRSLDEMQTIDPMVEAQLRILLGKAFESLTLFEEAERHLRRAVLLYSTEPRARDEVNRRMASRSLGNTLAHQTRFDEADEILQAVLAEFIEVHGELHQDTLDTRLSVGNLRYGQGRLEEAAREFEVAIAGLEKLHGQADSRTVEALSNFNVILVELGYLDRAEEISARVVESRMALYTERHASTLNALNTRASILKRLSRLDEARTIQARVLEIRRQLFPAGHRSTIISMINLAATLEEMKEYQQSEAVLTEARELIRVHRPDSELRYMTLVNLATLWRRQDRNAEAIPLYLEALELATGILEDDHWRVATLRRSIGDALVMEERFQEAEPYLLRAYRDLEASLTPEHLKTRSAADSLSILYDAWGRPDDAERWQRAADRAERAETDDS